MIYLVSLLCPQQHPVVGHPIEYANPNPSEAYLDTIGRDFYRLVKRGERPKCPKCGAEWTSERAGDWYISIGTMKAETMEEAGRELLKRARPERIPD